VVGNPTIDENSVGGRASGPSLGGTGSNLSLSLARFGYTVTWVGYLGPDAEPFLAPVRDEGVEIVGLECPGTLRFENRYPDPQRLEIRTQRAFSIPPAFRLSDIERVLSGRSFDYMALGPLTPGEIPLPLLADLVVHDIPMALDAQGLLRRVEADGKVSGVALREAATFPRGVRLLHLNEEEATLVEEGLGATGAGGEILRERLGVDLLAVTLGSRGAFLFQGRGRASRSELRLPAFLAPQASGGGDSTGCGDIFLAGLIHGDLSGWPLERSGRFATVAAGLNAAHEVLHVARAEEVERHLEAF